VPLTEPVNKGAADAAKSAEQGSGSRPSGSGR